MNDQHQILNIKPPIKIHRLLGIGGLILFLFTFIFMANAQAVVPPWEIEDLAKKPAPLFEIQDLTGKTISLKELQGSVVLLNFWATWCSPCVQEMPVFERVYKRFREKGLILVGISIDNNDGLVKNFLKKIAVTFPIAVDAESEIANRYKVFTYPTTFIIDKQGIVEEYVLGEREWEEEEFVRKLEKLLGQESPQVSK